MLLVENSLAWGLLVALSGGHRGEYSTYDSFKTGARRVRLRESVSAVQAYMQIRSTAAKEIPAQGRRGSPACPTKLPSNRES